MSNDKSGVFDTTLFEDPKMDIIKRNIVYTLFQTCGACPEQYDVVRDGKQVGYLRLRHGTFRVDCPDCGNETVLRTSEVKGDGIFDCDERHFWLNAAIEAIDQHLYLNPELLEQAYSYDSNR